jgi:hypothetical protein
MVNKNYFNVTVLNGSTKIFYRTKILIKKISAIGYSEREARRVSSGEEVTATSAVQREISWDRKQRRRMVFL